MPDEPKSGYRPDEAIVKQTPANVTFEDPGAVAELTRNIGKLLGGVEAKRRKDDETPGLKGQARLDDLLAHAKYPKDSPQFDDWIIGYAYDPNDPMFNILLRQLKQEAMGRSAERRMREGKAGPAEQAAQATIDAAGPQLAATAGQGTVLTQQSIQRREERQYDFRQSVEGRPIIKGLNVDEQQALAEEAGAEPGPLSEFVAMFSKDQALDVNRATSAVAVKSGKYAYAGQQEDTRGGAGFMRDVYLYEDDALASITSLDPDTIVEYQRRLGLPETGLVDSDLMDLWKEAVRQSELYARNGKKVEMKFIFDSLVDRIEASGGLGRGRGGGGGGGRGMQDFDYYFATMDILGDISGVKS